MLTYYYDAFGNIVESTGTVNNPFTYAGYQYDKETGLYYLNARMYDPKTARFMQEDSYRGEFNDPLSLNLYTYCHNEPIMYTDPTGHRALAPDDLGGIRPSTSLKKKTPAPTPKKVVIPTPASNSVKIASQVKENAIGNVIVVGTVITVTSSLPTVTKSKQEKGLQVLVMITSMALAKIASDVGFLDMPLRDNPKGNLETMPINENTTKNGIDDLPIPQNSKPILNPFPVNNKDGDRGVHGIPLGKNEDKSNIKNTSQGGSKGVTVKNNGNDVPVYRAGDDFTIKPGEIKIDKETGLVTDTKGVSVNIDPYAVPTKYGEPNLVESLPEGLKIIPRGKPGHYEIVPENPMTQAEFQSKLNQIKVSPIK